MEKEVKKEVKNTVKNIDIDSILTAGGCTLNSNGEAVAFPSGYQVSKKDCYKLATEQKDRIKKAVSGLLSRIKSGEFVGVWVDSGFVYIDISERIHNLKTALRVGKSRKQLSIYDWAADNCIQCGRA